MQVLCKGYTSIHTYFKYMHQKYHNQHIKLFILKLFYILIKVLPVLYTFCISFIYKKFKLILAKLITPGKERNINYINPPPPPIPSQLLKTHLIGYTLRGSVIYPHCPNPEYKLNA